MYLKKLAIPLIPLEGLGTYQAVPILDLYAPACLQLLETLFYSKMIWNILKHGLT